MSRNKKILPELRFPEFEKDGEWVERALGKIGRFIGGGTPSTSNPDYWNGAIQWYTPTEVKNGNLKPSIRTITEEGLKNSSAKLLPQGTILITTRATIGDAAIANYKCSTNQGFQSLIANKTESNLFWYYWILQHKNELVRRSSGSTFKEIGKNEIKLIQTLSPRKIEQQKIASCLSSLDEVIEAHSQKLELLKDHKKGLMQNLFPKEGEKAPKFRFAEFEKDGEWVEKKLGEVAELTSSKRVHRADYVDSGIPFFRGKEITELKKGKTPSDILFISEKQYLDIKEKYDVPKIGDVLITAVGTLGNVYQISNADRFYFKDGNLIWMKNILVDTSFLEILLEVKNKEVLGTAIGSSQKALTMKALNELKLRIPKKPKEQQKIAYCLSALDELITAEANKIEQLQQHKKGLMQGLFPKIV